jgi:hypothetical protein
VADGAVIAALQRAAPSLPNTAIVRRIGVDDRLDLVVALASRQPFRQPFHQPQVVDSAGRYGWSPQDRLGLFLQERSAPARVYTLATQAGPNDDCAARIERITAQELVLSCVGEKWATYDNQVFTYDIHAKALLRSFSYAPFRAARALHDSTGVYFVMDNNQQSLRVDIDRSGAPRVAIAASATTAPERDPGARFGPALRFQLSKQKNQYGSEYTLIVENPGPNQKTYPLPQTDLRTWQQARPDDAKSFSQPNQAEMNEEIGPHQREGGRLWFGKTFYNSEGFTGVGGFGYFDADTAAYRLYSPPEIQRWSVSAILVETDSVWLALYRRGEFANSAGGLLRWDRNSTQAQSFAVPEVATSIARAGNAIYLGTVDGIVALRGEKATSYFVDRTAAGRFVIGERD